MNDRLILLDYYHEYLKEQGVTQASFCYLDRKYKNNLSKFFYNEELLNIFHVKAPRVFNKTYEYEESIDSILEQYAGTVKIMHEEFVEPSKKYADVIIPRGGENKPGINMLQEYLQRRLG